HRKAREGEGGSHGKAGKENTEEQRNDGGTRIEGRQDLAQGDGSLLVKRPLNEFSGARTEERVGRRARLESVPFVLANGSGADEPVQGHARSSLWGGLYREPSTRDR